MIKKNICISYVIQIRKLEQSLNHRLVLKKFHRVIKFNQKAWLNSYIDMNADLRIQSIIQQRFFLKIY